MLDITRFAISRLREIELNQFGLTIEQSSILKILASLGGSSSLGELEYLTLRQPHSLSTLISRMNRLGMVGKKRAPEAKRYSIYITKRGQSLLGRVSENSLTEAFSCLSAKQLADFIRLFEILRSKALELLRVPFLKYLLHFPAGIYSGQSEPWHTPAPEAAWTLFDGTRFVVARLRELEISQYGLTMEQLILLQTLSGNRGSISIRTLEIATLRQHHTLSVLVNRMVQMGLLTKTRQAGHNRNTITITRKGEALLPAITRLSLEITFSSLKVRDIERLEHYLRLLHDKARDMLGKPFDLTALAEP